MLAIKKIKKEKGNYETESLYNIDGYRKIVIEPNFLLEDEKV